jgi:hypothetical protein
MRFGCASRSPDKRSDIRGASVPPRIAAHTGCSFDLSYPGRDAARSAASQSRDLKAKNRSARTMGPDQQRTTPQARRAARHPGHARAIKCTVTLTDVARNITSLAMISSVALPHCRLDRARTLIQFGGVQLNRLIRFRAVIGVPDIACGSVRHTMKKIILNLYHVRESRL